MMTDLPCLRRDESSRSCLHPIQCTLGTFFITLRNVLGALGEHNAAVEHYQTAVELDQRQPTVWKNLASAYHQVGNHDEEMRCFDRALELDPKQPEALISKANSLILDFQKPEEAIPLLELALTLHS